MHTELFSQGGNGGILLVGILAFGLGIAVTAFCFVLRSFLRDRAQENEEKRKN